MWFWWFDFFKALLMFLIVWFELEKIKHVSASATLNHHLVKHSLTPTQILSPHMSLQPPNHQVHCCDPTGLPDHWYYLLNVSPGWISSVGHPQNHGQLVRQSDIFWLVVGPPLWKIWKSIGMIRNPIYGKIKLMFQTTNQSCICWWNLGMIQPDRPSHRLFTNSHRQNVAAIPSSSSTKPAVTR